MGPPWDGMLMPINRIEATSPEAGFEELRAGNLGVRLAMTADEIDAVQALRFRVFYQEMGARADAATAASHRDRDDFDAIADHLLVVDHDRGEGPESVVGTYRLIRRHAAEALGRWYSEAEYDVSRLVAYPGPVLELGRSCVDAAYRSRGTLQLLWDGIAAYVFQHEIALMFGCASLPGTDLDVLADQLTYLHAFHLAPEELRPRAIADRYVEMRRKDPNSIDKRATLAALPPLVKGYLRLGGFVGDGAVLDLPFNTTDVAVVVKTDQITQKYLKHYERKHAER
jgi:putative hemolysin